ncbi:MAG: low molecular weight protein arginine phosphatase [Clostridia bacterium]|nr:low molecular weight protein arginine phosphatase [Clostridia bacterium]
MNAIETKEKLVKTETYEKSHSVLFVCTGNTCRSPMAEAVYNFYAKKYDLNTRAFSAGVAANGSRMSAHARTALLEAGYIDEDYEFVSRQVTEELCRDADAVIGLTEAHAMRLIMAFPEHATKIRALSHDISDPFGGYLERYKECLSEIAQAVHDEFFDGYGNE